LKGTSTSTRSQLNQKVALLGVLCRKSCSAMHCNRKWGTNHLSNFDHVKPYGFSSL